MESGGGVSVSLIVAGVNCLILPGLRGFESAEKLRNAHDSVVRAVDCRSLYPPIMIQSASAKIPEKHAHIGSRAAPGAADETGILLAPGLSEIIERWAELPDSVKSGILAMVRAVCE